MTSCRERIDNSSNLAAYQLFRARFIIADDRKQEKNLTKPYSKSDKIVILIQEASCCERTMKALLIILNFWVFTVLESKHPPGHLQPLGSHQPPVGSIASTETVPGAIEFFEQNALPGEPLLFKGTAKKMPAYSKWTDEYLR